MPGRRRDRPRGSARSLGGKAIPVPRLIDHEERREQIAEAAWRVILRDGVGGTSVRTVAAEAGLSTGALRHVFGSQSRLLVFALRLVVERATARMEALRPRGSAVKTVEAIAAQMLPLDRERRAEMAVYLALCSAANSDPGLRGPRNEAHETLRGACRWLIGLLDNGVDLAPDADREFEALRLHAVIDGLAAHVIYEPPPAGARWARRVLAGHLASLRCPPGHTGLVACSSAAGCPLAVYRRVLGGEPGAQVVQEHRENRRVGRGDPAGGRGETHLPGAFGVVVAEELRGFAEVAGPATPAGHDQGESGTDHAAGDAAAESPALVVGGGLLGAGTPAREQVAEVAVRLAGKQ
ncbi:hypothetical protein CFN78_17850 [Amycolatopsis antarctica]|uniref:HTH tetR-type domain-containing protein n=1 Tax=Amycolatopsis antarctica TaxID=1854586 RepID=A0A263D1L9_9PSEU|nr:hypothetical protein CFN78_17850 [Amycolatopsis antarctica]